MTAASSAAVSCVGCRIGVFRSSVAASSAITTSSGTSIKATAAARSRSVTMSRAPESSARHARSPVCTPSEHGTTTNPAFSAPSRIATHVGVFAVKTSRRSPGCEPPVAQQRRPTVRLPRDLREGAPVDDAVTVDVRQRGIERIGRVGLDDIARVVEPRRNLPDAFERRSLVYALAEELSHVSRQPSLASGRCRSLLRHRSGVSTSGGVEGIELNNHYLRAPYGRGPAGNCKASLHLIYDALDRRLPREGRNAACLRVQPGVELAVGSAVWRRSTRSRGAPPRNGGYACRAGSAINSQLVPFRETPGLDRPKSSVGIVRLHEASGGLGARCPSTSTTCSCTRCR